MKNKQKEKILKKKMQKHVFVCYLNTLALKEVQSFCLNFLNCVMTGSYQKLQFGSGIKLIVCDSEYKVYYSRNMKIKHWQFNQKTHIQHLIL